MFLALALFYNPFITKNLSLRTQIWQKKLFGKLFFGKLFGKLFFAIYICVVLNLLTWQQK